MKRILLLGFGKIHHMPYIDLYRSTFRHAEVDLVCWERDGCIPEDMPDGIAHVYAFSEPMENDIPLRRKVAHFLHYRAFVRRILRQKRYDLIVCMQATPGIVLLDQLRLRYRRKYLLDFRDLSYEHIPVYRMLTHQLAKGARAVFVSSNAFRPYLPDDLPVYTVHNYVEASLAHPPHALEKDRRPIRICFWGFIRGLETNRRLLDALGNDDRFELHYYGCKGADGSELERYAADKGYRNVAFHGPYAPEERYGFIAQTDIIHNAFDLDCTMTCAVSNKYYDGLIFGLPQLCTKGSHMGDIVTAQEVGLAVDLSRDDVAEQIMTYYQSVDADAFRQRCSERMEQIRAEQVLAKQLLRTLEDER